MKKYYLTFGQSHPLKDYWIEIEASSGAKAREVGFETFGGKFAFIYEEFQFFNTIKPELNWSALFPKGQVGNILRGY